MSRCAAVPDGRYGRRPWQGPALAAVAAMIVGLGVSGTASAASSGPPRAGGAAAHHVRVVRSRSVDRAVLADVFAKGRGLPRGAVAGIRAGSVHVATVAATGAQWAIAGFRPAPRLTASERVAFQDGADSGIFTRRGADRPWKFVASGVEPLSCDPAIPAAVREAWNLAPAVRCGGSSGGRGAIAAARREVDGSATRADRIAAIALSQVGESDIPASTNFGMDCDPYTPLDGPPYAAPSPRGCGYDPAFGVENENEEWCSDFADWVWRQAGVTADMDLINAGSNSFYAWGAAQHQPLTVDGTDPQVGDAVVFYGPGAITTSRYADHVGIVTAVNPDGTLDLVNGDFLGSSNISVQYNTDVDLSTWASQVWGSGEQWVFVAPPTGAQPPTPHIQASGPHTVAADTDTTFRVSGDGSGAAIASETWSFAVGNAVPGDTGTGRVVHHVFTDPGRTTVTVTATSPLGAITVKTWNVDVITPSSSAISTPSDAVYYSDAPVVERLFSVGGSGALTEESWDGAGWLDEALPGAWTPGGPVSALDYKNSRDTLTPHVFGRSASGALQETSLDARTWTTRTLAGSPAAGSPIVASNVVPSGPAASRPYPAVFFFDAAGRLVESSAPAGTWSTSVVSRTRGDRSLAVGTVEAGGAPAVTLYTTTAQGELEAFVQRGAGWQAMPLANPLRVAPGSDLAAVDSGGIGRPAVFFVDRAGHLAAAAPRPSGSNWRMQQISSAPSLAGDGVQAANVVTAAGTLIPEVFATSPSGSPQLVRDASGGWSTQRLPGNAGELLGLDAYPIPGGPQTLLFRGSGGVEADTAASGTGPWTMATLPSTPATFPDRVVLYAADSADHQAALGAASQAGLPASQVTGDFITAWDDTVSGDYLVISVGGPATSALYYNPCGWTDPDHEGAGSTPFSEVLGPTDQLPGSDLYEQADGETAAGTDALARDLAFYAVHGALPPGAQSLPEHAAPSHACSGSPSVS